MTTWIIIGAVIIGLILLGWILNAWRLAAKNRNVARRQPTALERARQLEEQHDRSEGP